MSLFCKSRVESKDIGSKLSTSIDWIYRGKKSKPSFYRLKRVRNVEILCSPEGYSL